MLKSSNQIKPFLAKLPLRSFAGLLLFMALGFGMLGSAQICLDEHGDLAIEVPSADLIVHADTEMMGHTDHHDLCGDSCRDFALDTMERSAYRLDLLLDQMSQNLDLISVLLFVFLSIIYLGFKSSIASLEPQFFQFAKAASHRFGQFLTARASVVIHC